MADVARKRERINAAVWFMSWNFVRIFGLRTVTMVVGCFSRKFIVYVVSAKIYVFLNKILVNFKIFVSL